MVGVYFCRVLGHCTNVRHVELIAFRPGSPPTPAKYPKKYPWLFTSSYVQKSTWCDRTPSQKVRQSLPSTRMRWAHRTSMADSRHYYVLADSSLALPTLQTDSVVAVSVLHYFCRHPCINSVFRPYSVFQHNGEIQRSTHNSTSPRQHRWWWSFEAAGFAGGGISKEEAERGK